MMTKQFKLDSYQSAIMGGHKHQNAARLQSVSAPYLYLRGGLFAVIVDKVADDAISGSLKTGCRVLDVEIERLRLTDVLAMAVRWARLSGGAAILPILSGGGKLNEPLDIDKIDTVEELRVYGASQITAYGNRYNDPSLPNYGDPIFYQINTQQGSFVVHESRLFTVSGSPIPEYLQAENIKWKGRDAVTQPYQTLLELDRVLRYATALLERKQQPIYKMTGLHDLVVAGMDEMVSQQVAIVDSTRNMFNSVTIDSADDYNIADLNLAGVTDILDVYKEQLAAETGIPIAVLFGRSAAGMNATGEGDFRAYYDLLEATRAKQITPALEKILALLAVQKSLPEKPRSDWQIEYAPLFEPSAKELAEMEKLTADTLNVQMDCVAKVVDLGILSQTQAETWLREQRWFGLQPENDNDRDNQDYADKIIGNAE